MTTGYRLLVDTCVALRSNDSRSPHQSVCRDAILQLSGGHWEACICAQVEIEYWAVATRPTEANGLGRSHEDVEADLNALEMALILLIEPPDIAARWRGIVSANRVSGRQVHDARLVALMRAYGISTILTLNGRDFIRHAGITVAHPSEVPGIVTREPGGIDFE